LSDRIDARKLAELLRGNLLSPVYHGENGLRTLKEVARSYLVITKDRARVMSRIKALYRSWVKGWHEPLPNVLRLLVQQFSKTNQFDGKRMKPCFLSR
jgi:hypothetical protein